MDTVLTEPWSVERFLAWEDKQEGKHEFDGTRIIEMTGGSRAHQRIVFNLNRLLDDAPDPERFDVIQEMRIAMGGKVRYPDVAVCGGRVGDTVRTLRDAIALFEVISDDAAATDRTVKPADYAALPSLRRYVLLEQDRMALTVLQRSPGGWTESEFTSGVLDLPELGVALPLDGIYRGVAAARHPNMRA